MEFDQEPESHPVTLVAPVYTSNQIRIGTLLGGPLLAGYFIAENYKVFGEYGKAKAAWMYAIAATLIIFGVIFLLPDKAVPDYVIPIIFCWIAYYLVERFQGAQIKAHAENGEGIFGWGRVILISLIGVAVTFVFVFIGVLLFGDNL